MELLPDLYSTNYRPVISGSGRIPRKRGYTCRVRTGAMAMKRLMELLLVIAIATMVVVTGMYLIRINWINSDLIFPLIVAGFFFSMRPLLFR
jgi:hypothetical protein